MELTNKNLDKLFADNRLDMVEALRIRDTYVKGEMCQCIDEKYNGGYWDFADDLMSKFEIKENDYEDAQSMVYDYMKDRWVRGDNNLDCNGEHD